MEEKLLQVLDILFIFFLLFWAPLALQNKVIAISCSSLDYANYNDCVNANVEGNWYSEGVQPLSGYCYGCNLAWPSDQYNTCKNNSITTWEKSCSDRFSSCPTNFTKNTSGECICANDSCCKTKFGDAKYDGNEIDGCMCAEGATFNGTKCVYSACGNDYTRHSNGTCICAGDSCCKRLFGLAYYDGNGTDGCACKSGTSYNQSKCVCTNDSCCRAEFGDAVYDGNPVDGCACMQGASYLNGECVLTAQPTSTTKPLSTEVQKATPTKGANCPSNQRKHPTLNMCIYKDTNECVKVFGESHYDESANSGCTCNDGFVLIENKCSIQCSEGEIYNPETKLCEKFLIGKVIHMDGSNFEGAEITIKQGENTQKTTTDSIGLYKVNTAKINGNINIVVRKEGYIGNNLKEHDSKIAIPDLILATPEEYEQEIRDIIRNFLEDARVQNASSISQKFSFNYTSRDSFQYESGVVYIPSSFGNTFWGSADWDTVFHELTHFLMDELAKDDGGDVGADREGSGKTNPDSAYDEGRAHFVSILFLNYTQNRGTPIKQNPKSYKYDWSKLSGSDVGGEEYENIVTRFWIEYYGSNVSANPTQVFKDMLSVNRRFQTDNLNISRHVRTFGEWVESKASQIWNNSKINDYSKVKEYDRLIRYANLNHCTNDFPYISASPDVVISFNPIARTGIVFQGKVHFVGGRIKDILYGKNLIEPHSEFTLNVYQENVLDIFLKEGKLIIKNEAGEVLSEVLPEEGYKVLNNGIIENLPEERKADLIRPIDTSVDYETVIVDSDAEVEVIGGLYPPELVLSICCGSVLMLLVLIAIIIFTIKKKKMLLILSLLFLCFSCLPVLYGIYQIVSMPIE